VCTSVSLTPALWRAPAGDAARVARSTVYVDARLDLTHRRFLAVTWREVETLAMPRDKSAASPRDRSVVRRS
jgi:hypothetical protein